MGNLGVVFGNFIALWVYEFGLLMYKFGFMKIFARRVRVMESVIGWGQNPVVDEYFYELSQVHYDSYIQLNASIEDCKARVVVFTSTFDVDEYLALKAEGSPRVACQVPIYVACATRWGLPALVAYMAEMSLVATASLVQMTKAEIDADSHVFETNRDLVLGLVEEHIEIGELVGSAEYWRKRMLLLLVATENYCEYNDMPQLYSLVESARLLDFSENAETAEFWRKEVSDFSQAIGGVFNVDVGDFEMFNCPVTNACSLVSFIDFGSSYC